MGTQNAWGGSGGRAWGKVRNEARRPRLQPSRRRRRSAAAGPERRDELACRRRRAGCRRRCCGTAGSALCRLVPRGEPRRDAVEAAAVVARRAVRAGGGGSGRGGGARTGTGRSRARAAGVGGGVLAAGLAYQRGDAQTLESLGLNLDELRSMSSLKRANAILNAVVGADGGIEETELRHVNGRVLKQVLNDGLDGVAAIRLYVVEYVMQVWATETAEARRNGAASASASGDTERQLRNALTAKARQLQVAASSTAAEIRTAIGTRAELDAPADEGHVTCTVSC